MNCKPIGSLRNTKEPYRLPYNYRLGLIATSLHRHIDPYTLEYKIWHLSAIIITKVNRKQITFRHSNGDISYCMELIFEPDCIQVTCDCNRRVKKLCHHSYTALLQLLNQGGDGVFNDYALRVAQAA